MDYRYLWLENVVFVYIWTLLCANDNTIQVGLCSVYGAYRSLHL